MMLSMLSTCVACFAILRNRAVGRGATFLFDLIVSICLRFWRKVVSVLILGFVFWD